jgi:hypothetical protein
LVLFTLQHFFILLLVSPDIIDFFLVYQQTLISPIIFPSASDNDRRLSKICH